MKPRLCAFRLSADGRRLVVHLRDEMGDRLVEHTEKMPLGVWGEIDLPRPRAVSKLRPQRRPRRRTDD